MWEVYIVQIVSFVFLYTAVLRLTVQPEDRSEYQINLYSVFIYNPKSEKVGTVWKTQIKKESSDF